MVKQFIYDDWLRDNPAILARFPLKRLDWGAAWAMRQAHPVAPWNDEEHEELRAFNQEIAAPTQTMARIEQLRDPATRVIVTGQQAGLALGPLFTLYKALGAILHARDLERRVQSPVIACFWIASEDHDFEEVRDVHWLGRDAEMESFRYEPSSHANGRSMADVPVEPSMRQLIERLDQTTGDTEFKRDVLRWLETAIERGGNLEGFFGRALMGLLGRFGLVALRPSLLGLRRTAARLFEQELRAPRASSRAVMKAGEDLAALGYAPGLHRQENDINFFLYENGLRGKLSWAGDRITIANNGDVVREASAEELIEEVREDPRKISTNVISRPVCQDAALPTLAYVAGPGEATYFAQLREVYALWQTPMPMIMPRPRVVLVDSRVRRFFQKSDLTLEEFQGLDSAALAKRVLAQEGDNKEMAALNEAREKTAAAVAELKKTVGAVSPAVEKAIERLAESQAKGLQTVEDRLGQELRQRNEALMRQLERVEQWLRPQGQPQERVYSALSPLLINYGMQVIDTLLEKIDLARTDLQAIEL